MRLSSPALSIVFAIGLAVSASMLNAQSAGPVAGPMVGRATPPDIHQALEGLADQPATHMGFVLDRSMLQGAQQILQSEGMTPERAAAALTSISYDNYKYAQPATYTPDAMASILGVYRAAGWKHMVDSHEKAYAAAQVTPEGAPARRRQATDLWLHFTGEDVDGITIMTRGAKNVNLVQVACDLKPIELLHLSGHFGIPKVDPSAVMVPDPKER